MASEHGEGVASEVAERWDDDFEPKSAGKLLTAKDDAEADKQSVNLSDSDSSSSFGVPSENDDSDDGQEGHVGVDDESESISDDDDSLGSFSSSNDENDDFLRMWNPSAQGVLYVIFHKYCLFLIIFLIYSPPPYFHSVSLLIDALTNSSF